MTWTLSSGHIGPQGTCPPDGGNLTDGRIVAEGPPIQVLTGPQIQRHYGAHVDVIDHRGHPVVVPVRTPHTDPPERPGHLEPEGDRHATT